MEREKEIQETLKLYYDLLTPKPIREQLDLLEQAIENIIKHKFTLREEIKPTTDREIVDLIQETYSFIYCLTKGIEYETFDVREHLKKDEYFQWIANYKIEHFADEILREYGLELLERSEKGFLVRDTTPKQKLN